MSYEALAIDITGHSSCPNLLSAFVIANMLPALCPRSIAFGSKSVACGNVFIVLGSANKHKYVVCSQDTAFLQELSTLGGVPTIHIYKGVLQLDPISSASKALKEEKEAQKDKLTKAERREIATLINQPDPTDVPQKRVKRKIVKGPNPLSVKKRKALVGRNSEALPTAEQQRPIRKRKRKPSTKEDV